MRRIIGAGAFAPDAGAQEKPARRDRIVAENARHHGFQLGAPHPHHRFGGDTRFEF